MEFCHLHCHTQYSLLDGAARIERLVERATKLEIPALAITDHGNLYGVPEFYKKTKAAGIQPIIGCEFYVCRDMHDQSDRRRFHQVLLAKNKTGYQNLIKLSSLSYTDGFYYKPRIDRELLKKYSEGIVATTCCIQGEVPQAILRDGEEAARAIFEDYLSIFGEDYYIEIQDHAIEDQRTCNAVLSRWAKEYNVKMVATNDVHYVDQKDADAQDVLLCLQTGKDFDDPNRMRFENDQFYLKSTDEMRSALLPGTKLGVLESESLVDAALDTTREIADKCAFDLPMGGRLMPRFHIPNDFAGENDYLRHLAEEGARRRYGEISQTVRDRLDHELGIIKEMGYAGYFLIVQDFTTVARERGVTVGPGRGSAAGSVVAYCLGITNIDPLRYDLLFERFLNPERISMPDIDIDFDDRGRSKVIDYVVEKYGRESVCQIVTFGTMGAKSVIRDVGRVLGVPLAETDRIAKLVPHGVKVSLEHARNAVPEFKELYGSDNPDIHSMMRYADVLEGSTRHTGVHAAGVIIAPGDVSDYVPVAVQKGKQGGGETLTTQYEGKWIEEFGLLKMDFLGLTTLTIVDDALDLIKENHGVEIDLDEIPFDDEKTFELFQRADTVAIFQFESDGMREWLRELKPTELNDLIAMNALYRPGPMELIPNYIARKHGREEVTYPHPMLEEILEPTYGIPVYQEQVMQMAQTMGGYTLGAADLLRRAMGKKKKKEMAEQRRVFAEGAAKNGVSERKANEIFDMMETFAGYGFNKSHSAAYSVVAYQSAYLKAHYPAEYMAATLTAQMHDSRKLAGGLEATRSAGLTILPPSINHSEAYFTVEPEGIRFGLAAIKTVGHGAIEAIIEARESGASRRSKEGGRKKGGGAFKTLFDLVRELDLRSVGKATLEALAQAGAMDGLGGHRAQLFESVETAWTYAEKTQADKAAGQNSLFGGNGADSEVAEFIPALPKADPWSRGETLRRERELMGFYISGHPLDDYKAEIRAFCSMRMGETDRIPDRSEQTVCGIVTTIKRRTTKSGRPIGFMQLEDTTGQAEVVLFAQTLERYGHLIAPDEVVLVKGRAETRGDLKVVAEEVIPMWRVRSEWVKSMTLNVDVDTVTEEDIAQLAAICAENTGHCRLNFSVSQTSLSEPVTLHARSLLVDLTPDLMKDVRNRFGWEAITLSGAT